MVHYERTPYHHSSSSSFTSQVARSNSSTTTSTGRPRSHAKSHPTTASTTSEVGTDRNAAQARLLPLTSSSSTTLSSITPPPRKVVMTTTMTYNPSSHIFPRKPPTTAVTRNPSGQHHNNSMSDGGDGGSPAYDGPSFVRSVASSQHSHSHSHSRRGSDLSLHSFASMSTTSLHRSTTYSPPPGLAPARESEDGLPEDKPETLDAFVSSVFPSRPQPPSSLPRSARVDQTSSISAAAQWLLTTAPPATPTLARRATSTTPLNASRSSSSLATVRGGAGGASTSSFSSFVDVSDSGSTFSSSTKGLSWGRKSLQSVFGLTARRQTSMSSLSRPEPKPVTLQLSRPAVRRSGRLDRASPIYDVPKTWEEWTKRYANGEMDVENPPPPPPSATYVFPSANAGPVKRSPFDEQKLSAPLPPLESVRQKMISRLELFGARESSPRPASSVMAPVASSASSHLTSSTRDSSLFDRRVSVASTAQSSVYASSSKSPGQLQPSVFPSKMAPSSSLSFAHHPALQSILSRARQIFDVKIVLVTILLEEKQRFLAVSGMPEGVESLPREVTFCAHTVLNGERGLIVLDTQRDWRFRNNVLSVSLNTRLYAGMPVYPPANAELEEEAGGRLPIGTLCLLDDQPRTEFSRSERAQLRSLASDVSVEIEAWVSDLRSSVSSFSPSITELPTSKSKQVAFEEAPASTYINWSDSKTPTAATFNDPPSPAHVTSTPPSKPPRSSALKTEASDSHLSSSYGAIYASRLLPPMPEESTTMSDSLRRSRPAHLKTKPTPPACGPRRMVSSPSLGSPTGSAGLAPSPTSTARSGSPPIVRQTFPSAKTRPPPRTSHQRLLDAATKSLGDSLELSLVYLVSLSDLAGEGPHALTLLSAHNLPSTTPSFDSVLHLKALRAAEGGLLYRNPAIAKLAPEEPFDGPGFASGILLPVAERTGTGWVLAGYTKDAQRVFSEEELDHFVDISGQLAKLVAGESLSSDAE